MRDNMIYRSLKRTFYRIMQMIAREISFYDLATMLGIFLASFVLTILSGEETFNGIVFRTITFVFILDSIPFFIREWKIKKKETEYRKNTKEAFNMVKELDSAKVEVQTLDVNTKTVYKTNERADNDFYESFEKLREHLEKTGSGDIYSDEEVFKVFETIRSSLNNEIRRVKEISTCPYYDVNEEVSSWVVQNASPIIYSLNANMNSLEAIFSTYAKEKFAIYSGIQGEMKVQNVLANFSNGLNPLYGIRFQSEKGTVENDVLLFTKQGIFSLEVKNIGQFGSKKVKIEKDGLWYEWKHGKWIKSNKDKIFDQVNRHTALTEKLLNDTFGFSDKHIVKSIIVIPNDNIEISNESNFEIVRPNQIVNLVRNHPELLTPEDQEKFKEFFRKQDIGQGKFEHLDAEDAVSKMIEIYDRINIEFNYLSKIAEIQELYVQRVNNDNLGIFLHLKELNFHRKKSVI